MDASFAYIEKFMLLAFSNSQVKGMSAMSASVDAGTVPGATPRPEVHKLTFLLFTSIMHFYFIEKNVPVSLRLLKFLTA